MKGCFPAIATPFNSKSEIDFDSFSNLVEHLISGGVDGIFVAGSTGEGLTLTDLEYQELLKRAKEIVNGRIQIYSGISASSTQKACEYSVFAKNLKLDGLLVATPPYNKPTQEGIIAHFSEISKQSSLPIVAYNVPGRTCSSIQPKTLATLLEKKIIISLKDATGSIENVLDVLAATNEKLPILSGEDSLTHTVITSGGTGVISVVANAFPELTCSIVQNALNGNISKSLKTQLELLPIIKAMFIESNPIPVKYALYKLGVIKTPTMRLPLTEATKATKDTIDNLIGNFN